MGDGKERRCSNLGGAGNFMSSVLEHIHYGINLDEDLTKIQDQRLFQNSFDPTIAILSAEYAY